MTLKRIKNNKSWQKWIRLTQIRKNFNFKMLFFRSNILEKYKRRPKLRKLNFRIFPVLYPQEATEYMVLIVLRVKSKRINPTRI